MAYTTDYRPITPQLGIQGIHEASATAQHPIGTVITAKDFGSNQNGVAQFIYLKGAASIFATYWVTYNLDDGSTALLAANAIGPVAVSMSAATASEYGWFQITGKAVAQALTGFVDNANVYATATPGGVDDAVVSGDRVKNAKGASAVDAPQADCAEFEIQYPYMDDGLAG